MTELPGFDIRYTQLSDTPYLRKWMKNEAVLKWFPMTAEQDVENAIQCWMGFVRWNASLTATIDQVPCGLATLFLMPYKKVAHHALLKIVVDPEKQRKGVGYALIKNLKHLAKEYFHLEMLVAEIFEGNPLFFLLKKSNFHELFRQKKYVKEGKVYKDKICLEVLL